MKKIVFGFLVLICTSSLAQFKISGEIKNFGERPLMIRIYNGANEKLINRVEADKNGKFSVNIPRYSGVVSITNQQRTSVIEIATDNEDVDFTAEYDHGARFSNIEFRKGKTAMSYIKYQSYQNFNDMKQNIFPIIKALYQPGDEFYEAMVKEENRIAQLNPASDHPFLKYYIQTAELANAQAETKEMGSVYQNRILNKLINDNDYLEGSGFMTQLVLNYFRFGIFGASSQNEINSIIDNEISKLIEETDIETSRGQNVLSAIFSVLPKEQFGSILEKYYQQANDLTCQLTDELKTNLSAHNITKVGNQVPDIIFNESVNGYKSLYDIKADKKIIVFWASWCPACRDEMPFIKEYYTNFKKEGGEIVAISLDYDKNEFINYTKDYSWINYTDLSQWDTQSVADFGVDSTPTLFLVDKDNKLIKKVSHISELID